MASAEYATVLTRYLEKAQALSQYSGTKHGESSETSDMYSGFQKKVSDPAPGGSETREFDNNGTDPTANVMKQLLARQANAIVELHKHVALHGNEHKFDEELLKRRIADLISISSSKFYAYRYDLLPVVWRQIYTDACILESFQTLLRTFCPGNNPSKQILDATVEKLDRALIIAGGGGHREWLEKTLWLLEEAWIANEQKERPAKRQRYGESSQREFSRREPYGRPTFSTQRECPRYSGWTMPQFEDYMNSNEGEPRPIVFTDLMGNWPALTDRPWKYPEYLLSKTFGGRRLVPVELGRSYVDDGWGQDLIPFREFLGRYVEQGSSTANKTGYLAQHNLFQQIPALRNDICIPDFCWVDVPSHPTIASQNQPPVDVPQLNAWFGPARTITPLHTDGYHNLLCQVVGAKYIRLYPPRATPVMRPRASEHGVDMSNTSELDVGVLEGWDEKPEDMVEEDLERMRRDLEGTEYWECILEPGDTLVIPIGWWHYVRSLSVSFSVSFWWNS
ncbi:lysine-specific demethylase 8 [Fusarium longipes]|uniref:Lysine-specific demethylase 8 n=1 Tax=Fusarium longipes TaxID=694270 RepID=A0A395RXW0_9HYPO|nr:lysine-specific demethylase 8 [Fusarium longipes]